MRNKYFLLMIWMVGAVFSCAKTAEVELVMKEEGTKVFEARTPSDETKAFMDSGYYIHWTEDDRISVFCSTTNEQYRFKGLTGEDTGTFENLTSPAAPTYGRNYAIYPYLIDNTSSGEGSMLVQLPSQQAYCENSFGLGANTMTAVTENVADNTLKFKNACGYLLLKIYGGDKIKSITLKGNNNEKISGQAIITAEYDAAPLVEMGSEATNEITLNCPDEGVPTQEEKESFTPFWIVVPPTTFTEGFTVDITNTDGVVVSCTTNKSASINRNKILKMAPVKMDNQSRHELLTFSLSDGTSHYSAFDISNGYVNVQVPNGTDMKNMTASFTYDGASVKVNGVVQTSGVDSHDFSDFVNPPTYVVSSGSGLTQSYIIRLFNLPIVIATTQNGAAITSKDNWIGGQIIIRNDDGTVSDYGDIEIKGRGNSTWTQPKKPFTFKLSSKQSVLGMNPEKRWNLLANWRDRTLVRNAAGLELARKTASLSWTPDGRFVELILNGEYLGNYYLCEHIKVSSNRVNIVEMQKTDTSDVTITGGYLLEYDTFYDETNKFRSSYYDYPVNIKSPDETGFNMQVAYIESYINELEYRLKNSDQLSKRTYLEMLDPYTFIDWWFVHEIVGAIEPSGPRSCYFYKDRGGKLEAGPVWDFDTHTFVLGDTGFHVKNALYYAELFKDSYFIDLVKEKWPDLKARLSDMVSFIEGQQQMILNSSMRDASMWPIPIDFVRNGDEQLSIPEANQRMIDAYTSRMNELDNLINSLVVDYDNKSGGNEDYGDQDDDSGDFGFHF